MMPQTLLGHKGPGQVWERLDDTETRNPSQYTVV